MDKKLLEDCLYPWRTARTWWYSASLRARARFKRTLLGDAWLGASNLLSIAVLAYVYIALLNVKDPKTYVVYVGIGLTIWQFIGTMINSSGSLLASKKQRLLNTPEQPIYYFLQEWAFQVQGFIQSWVLVLLGLAFFAGPILVFNGITLALLPILNLLLFCLSAQIVFAVLGVRFQDFYQVIPLILQLSFLSTPILFTKIHLGSKQWIANVNPFYRILEPVRQATIDGRINWEHQLLVLLINAGVLLILLRILNRNRQKILFLL
jgi:lipopolysaccharide transport system permease protein